MRTLSLCLAALAATPLLHAAVPSSEELATLIPSQATVVMAVDAAALRAHPRAQEWLLEHQAPWSGVDDEATQFLRDAGLDPLRDVDAMIFGVALEAGRDHALAVFAGRYDPASIGAALLKRGAEQLTVAGAIAYRVRNGAAGERGDAVVVSASSEVVLTGDETMVAAALASRRTANPLVREEVAAGRVELRAPFWMVAAIPEAARELPEGGPGHEGGGDLAMHPVLQASKAVRRVSAWATVDENLTVHGFATADGEENAELLRDAVKGALAAMRLSAQQQVPELVDVLRDVKVELNGTNVAVHGSVPLALLEKLAAEHHQPCEPPRESAAI